MVPVGRLCARTNASNTQPIAATCIMQLGRVTVSRFGLLMQSALIQLYSDKKKINNTQK